MCYAIDELPELPITKNAQIVNSVFLNFLKKEIWHYIL